MLFLLLVSTLTVAFNIQPVMAWTGGTIYIKADGSIDPPDAPIITYDNVTYTLTGNITSFWHGIVVERDNVIIDGAGHTLQGSALAGGVDLSFRSNVTIKNIKITMFEIGIHLYYSSNNSIFGNDITNNLFGVSSMDSSNNTISLNNFMNNRRGIYLYSPTYTSLGCNTISENNIINNGYGIGFSVYGPTNDNKIYHNNFINNTVQAGEVNGFPLKLAGNNTWDNGYPSGGNYWSDYTGIDLKSGPNQDLPGSDGIGDSPYVTDENNRDRYPLMHPWSPLPVHNINTGLGYATIQEAINAAETVNGHTIFVESGIYYENVVVNKSLTLMGENREATIIDANGTGDVIDVKTDDVVIESFTIQNSGYEASGIDISSCEWAIIRNNSIINNDCGINIWDSRHNTISGNNVTNNYWGIFLQYSVNNTLRNNHMSSNQRNFCVWGDVPSYFYHDIDSSNTVDDKPIYYWVNQQNRTVPIDAGYVALIYSTNIMAQNLDLKNNYQGLLLVETENSLIMGNNITNNTRGIHLVLSSNNTISENNMTNNGFGISLEDAVNNTIFRNNVAKNYYGIWLMESSNNEFYHNNFINNTEQVDTCLSMNIWDGGYPPGGNYWSDYTGIDVKRGPRQNLAGSDGIGDTPYVIDANNRDRYPLMNSWGTGTPVASFVWSPSVPEVNELVTFDASASMPVGGEIVGYEWDFGDGNHAYGKIVTHQFDFAGNYTVTLNVTDSEGLWDTEQKQIEVKAPPPSLTVSISPTSASVLIGQSVTFTSTASGGSYQWYLNGNPVSGATSDTWTFTPTTGGIYYVHLKVTDDKGNTAQSDAARITVATVPVGGYSISIQLPTTAKPVTLHIALLTILTAIFIKIKQKTRRKHRQ
jgi:parallel beta-helix repeat protein